MSETPRTDAVAAVGDFLRLEDFAPQYNALLMLCRQLEKELSAMEHRATMDNTRAGTKP